MHDLEGSISPPEDAVGPHNRDGWVRDVRTLNAIFDDDDDNDAMARVSRPKITSYRLVVAFLVLCHAVERDHPNKPRRVFACLWGLVAPD